MCGMDNAGPTEADVLRFILSELATITNRQSSSFASDIPLIGPDSLLKSRELVELLLALEDYTEEKMGVGFDWTSDSAMSRANSIFRTVRTLSRHIYALRSGK